MTGSTVGKDRQDAVTEGFVLITVQNRILETCGPYMMWDRISREHDFECQYDASQYCQSARSSTRRSPLPIPAATQPPQCKFGFHTTCVTAVSSS